MIPRFFHLVCIRNATENMNLQNTFSVTNKMADLFQHTPSNCRSCRLSDYVKSGAIGQFIAVFTIGLSKFISQHINPSRSKTFPSQKMFTILLIRWPPSAVDKTCRQIALLLFVCLIWSLLCASRSSAVRIPLEVIRSKAR